jgi:hypothetical protein
MKKKMLTVIVLVLTLIALVGCVEFQDVESVEFLSFPKTTYVVDEPIDHFTISVTAKGETQELSSDHPDVVITGFDTSTSGTRTMVITVKDLEDAQINFVYTVVNSLADLLFAGGTGIEGDPYLISTPQQLSNIRLHLDKHFKLANDIDLEDVQWSPIGTILVNIVGGTMSMTIVEGFSGHFDGDDYKIMNFTITEDGASDSILQPSALFSGISSAVIENVTFESPDIQVAWGANALSGLIEDSQITNVHITNGYFKGRAPSGLSNRIVGDTTLTNVTVDADIVVKNVFAAFGAYRTSGGISVQVQPNSGTTTTFDNVHFNGTIYTEWSDPALPFSELGGQSLYAGLLVGRVQGSGTFVAINSSGTGTITGNIGRDYTIGTGDDNKVSTSQGFYGYIFDEDGNPIMDEEVETAYNIRDKNILDYDVYTVAQRKLIGSFFKSANGATFIIDGQTVLTSNNNETWADTELPEPSSSTYGGYYLDLTDSILYRGSYDGTTYVFMEVAPANDAYYLSSHGVVGVYQYNATSELWDQINVQP